MAKENGSGVERENRLIVAVQDNRAGLSSAEGLVKGLEGDFSFNRLLYTPEKKDFYLGEVKRLNPLLVLCDRLEGDWKGFYELTKNSETSFAFFSGNPRVVEIASELGVPFINKYDSVEDKVSKIKEILESKDGSKDD